MFLFSHSPYAKAKQRWTIWRSKRCPCLDKKNNLSLVFSICLILVAATTILVVPVVNLFIGNPAVVVRINELVCISSALPTAVDGPDMDVLL